jgi:hypothetical protein
LTPITQHKRALNDFIRTELFKVVYWCA